MKMSDRSIRAQMGKGRIDIHPIPPDHAFQPCSVDLRLGRSFYVPFAPAHRPQQKEPIGWLISDLYVLQPGKFILASTHETVMLSSSFMAQVHGKSTLARLGLQVEAAGLVDPGFEGTITLELVNLSPGPIPLSAGMPVCQMTFERLDWPADRPYGHPELNSHYQGQQRATPAAQS